jgi:sec-independent protein translocase protein TatA
MFGGVGIQEIVIILIVGLLVFGAARLPKIAKSLGQGIREFKKTVKDLDEDDDENKIKYVNQGPPHAQQQQPGPYQPQAYPQYNQGMQYQQPQGAQQPPQQASQPIPHSEEKGPNQDQPEQGQKTS